MNWREFWHWLTTSRYTRHLERENQRLALDNDALLKALYPTIRAARTEVSEVPKKPAAFSSFTY